MNAGAVRLTLDSASSHYQPGERLSGRYMVDGSQPWAMRAVELSVLWYTTGKGDEDMAVHHFERHVSEACRPLDLRVPRRFSTVLPASPLSYDGEIVKVEDVGQHPAFVFGGIGKVRPQRHAAAGCQPGRIDCRGLRRRASGPP